MKAINFIKEYYMPIIVTGVVLLAVVIATVEIINGHFLMHTFGI